MEFSIDFENIDAFVIDDEKMSNWIQDAIQEEGKEGEFISVILCTDEYLLKLNQSHLQHDYYTDIITFDYTEGDDISGDLFISLDRVKDNAQNMNIDWLSELHRVVIHGVLHLLGYSDHSDQEKAKMRQKEDHYLKNILI